MQVDNLATFIFVAPKCKLLFQLLMFRCNNDGTAGPCTRMECTPTNQGLDNFVSTNKQTSPYNPTTQYPVATTSKVFTLSEVQDPSFRCTAFQTFEVECNKCFCNFDQTPGSCTRFKCTRKIQNKQLNQIDEHTSSYDPTAPTIRTI